MAMSTRTEPGRIAATISALTSLGAAAPGISTAPITRSAAATSRSIASVVEYSVLMRPPQRSSSCIRRGSERSITTTSASSPIAMRAALVPDTPPPSTTTRPGATPGTPPSRIPAPPCVRMR